MAALTEPLIESAPLAWHEAPRLCHRDERTGATCLWYHRVWQYLRLLGIVSTVGTNDAFLNRVLREYARSDDHRRLLIAGTADYGMLARVTRAYDDERRASEVTVLDRCETALLLNQWYAERVGRPIQVVCADALEFQRPQAFDLICTHNFLGRFDDRQRRRLISTWRALLRPGGIVVTTLRIRPGSTETRITYSESQARELRDRVIAAATASRESLPVPPAELGHAAFEYAVRKDSHAIASNEGITDAFERAGFEIVLADKGGGRSERERDRPASTAGTDTYRMRLIAKKR
jgi:SAM-dependent methyltransferase